MYQNLILINQSIYQKISLLCYFSKFKIYKFINKIYAEIFQKYIVFIN